MISDVVGFLVIGVVLMIAFHEGGHYITAEKKLLKPRMNGLFEMETEIEGSKKDKIAVLFDGIWFGIIPILVIYLVIGWFALLLFPLYFVGIRTDIENLIRLWRDK